MPKTIAATRSPVVCEFMCPSFQLSACLSVRNAERLKNDEAQKTNDEISSMLNRENFRRRMMKEQLTTIFRHSSFVIFQLDLNRCEPFRKTGV
jgi:hypothetical protein